MRVGEGLVVSTLDSNVESVHISNVDIDAVDTYRRQMLTKRGVLLVARAWLRFERTRRVL